MASCAKVKIEVGLTLEGRRMEECPVLRFKMVARL